MNRPLIALGVLATAVSLTQIGRSCCALLRAGTSATDLPTDSNRG